jgi:hypothetical protein
MKVTKLLKIAFVFAAILTLGACEDEDIKLDTGEDQKETVDAE